MNTMKIDRQAGVALVFCLVMLLLLTTLGLSGVQMTSMQERMARNARDVNLAFQAAESAIKDAETYLTDFGGVGAFQTAAANGNGLYLDAGFDQLPNWKTNGLWDSGNVVTAPTEIPGVAEQPKYIIEYVKRIGTDPDTLNIDNIGQDTGGGLANVFRVTVYGTGGSSTSHVLIQSTYGKAG